LAYLVQLLLPRYANDGTAFPGTQFAAIRTSSLKSSAG
jgi:hypothetical protein